MKLCISDVFGSLNRGDALLCDALVQSIGEAFPAARLTGVAHFPEIERTRHPDIDWQEAPSRSQASNLLARRLVNGARSGLALGYSALGAPSSLSGLYPLPNSQKKAIEHLKSADLVISSAGGFLLDANVTIYSHLLQFHFMRRFGTPYVLAPQTIGPIKSARLKAMTASALSDAHMIAVREQYSYDFVTNELGIDAGKVVRTTDIAFEYDKMSKDGAQAALSSLGVPQDEAFIGATTVNWQFRKAENPKESYENYKKKMVLLLKAVHERTGLRVVLFNQVSQDLPLARLVADACKDFVVIDEADRSTEVMRGMIARANVMLGSRFHSCIFALLSRVPLCCLAYTYKSTGIMEDLGLSEYVNDIGSFDVNETADMIKKLNDNRDAEAARVNDAVSSMRFPRFSDLLRTVATDLSLKTE